MDIAKAKIILANLRERIEVGVDDKYRLSGIITQSELDALDFFSIGPLANLDVSSLQDNPVLSITTTSGDEPAVQGFITDSDDEDITLDLSSLELDKCDSTYRVCLDFGTAMSKAAFVNDNEVDDLEKIVILNLGIPGDQEQIDEVMLVSSVFIDSNGLVWFGQHAVEQSQMADNTGARMDNIKRALSEGNLNEKVDGIYNPTQFNLTYKDIVLSYLSFFTWAVNRALSSDVDEPVVPGNFNRRFAMPCFPRANARLVEGELKILLGEAQVLADTFGDEIHQGLPLKRFLSALKQLRSAKHSYPFVGECVTEPLGVAGSLLSWHSSQDSLALVVDIGAGTSDFSLYRLKVTVTEDGEIDEAMTVAAEVEGTARGITEAGNHLDKILMAYILKKSAVDSTHQKYRNITHALERDIRNHKESLFNAGYALIPLYSGEAVEVVLDEFLSLEAVKVFEESLRKTMTEILDAANQDWIDWVRADPRRRLTIVLTGGGATLPMAKRMAEGTVTAHEITIPVAAAKSFPDWLRNDYPDIEDHYTRVAVSLGGARKNIIRSMGALSITGSVTSGHQLESFLTSGV